jgi:hypothetical protein
VGNAAGLAVVAAIESQDGIPQSDGFVVGKHVYTDFGLQISDCGILSF